MWVVYACVHVFVCAHAWCTWRTEVGDGDLLYSLLLRDRVTQGVQSSQIQLAWLAS